MSVAGVAHLVERHLAKVEVASSSLVTRSIEADAKASASFLCHHRLEQLNATVRWTVDPRWGHFDIRVGTTRAVARQQKAVSLRNFGRIQNNPLSGKSADMVVASKQQESENSLFTNSLFYAIILPVLARWCSRLARQPVTLEVDGSSPFRVAKKVILRDGFFSYPKKDSPHSGRASAAVQGNGKFNNFYVAFFCNL